MNILQIAHCFPPESMTGAEIYTYNLSKELSQKHDVSVFYRIKDPSRKEYEVTNASYDGLNVYKINNTLRECNSLDKIYRNGKVEERFADVLDKVRPDVAHVHHLLFLSAGILDELKKRGIPIIFTLHDYWLVCPRGQLLKSNLELCKDPLNANCLYCLASGLNPKNLLKKLLKLSIKRNISKKHSRDLEKIYEKVDLFISPSKFLRNRFISWGMPQEKIIYSDNGMDFDLFKDIEKIKSDKIRFTFIGTLIPSKGAHVLIKAFNRIKGDKAVLKIYGTSPVNNGIFDYGKRIKRISAGNKNIKFMGAFNNNKIARVFKEIDVLILPSLWQENAPLVLREAILTKTFVIASDTGGVSELIREGGNGMLFKTADEKCLYDKIKAVIEKRDILDRITFTTGVVKDIKTNSEEIEELCKRLCTKQ